LATTASAITGAVPERRRLAAFLRGVGADAALFSVKCFVAAMLAYYIALRIGLTRPYWAITTSYIVAQPLAGAVLSKAVFRVLGTFLGAVAAVALVPTFVNEPIVLCTALALWLGLCLYISLLDRTPRSYIFLLAGYTASIIGFPSVNAPGQIFEISVLRVEEIVLGILCASLVHGVVLPRTVAGQLLERIDRMLADAERWSADGLSKGRSDALAADRRRLALDINELHQLSTHLPFDTARLRPRVRTVRALQDQVSLILPLASAVEDRLEELQRLEGPLPPEVRAVIGRTSAWLIEGAKSEADAAALIADCAALEPTPEMPLTWAGALRLSLLSRLAELIAAHRDARALREQLRAPTALPVSPSVAALLAGTQRRVLHRDRGSAFRSAMGTIATVLIGSAFWILTAWPEGAGAVLIAGVCCALFGASDAPAPAVMRFFWGSLVGMILAMFYTYAIFPQVTTLPVLMAVIAPVSLLLGARLGLAPVSFVALGAVLGFFNGIALGDRYAADFAAFVNSSIGQLVGTLFAAVTVGLFQTIGAERSTERLIEAGWRDLAKRSNARGLPDARGWTSRMLDRIGLLAPRIASRGLDPGQPLLDILVDLRIGLVAGELRTMRVQGSAEEREIINPVLEGLAAYYRALRVPVRAPAPAELLERIDRALDAFRDRTAAEHRRGAILALTSLRRNLFPVAPPWISDRVAA
jgi:uncharacterized membrane protein YccC